MAIQPQPGSYRIRDFVVDESRQQLLHLGKPVALTPKQFETLLYMVKNPGRLLYKEELLKAIWPDSFVEESNLSQNVFWLRKALRNGDPEEAQNRYILTVPGKGYRFVAEVTDTSTPLAPAIEPTPPPQPITPSPAIEAAPLVSVPTSSSGTHRWLRLSVAAALLLTISLGTLFAFRSHQRKLQAAEMAARRAKSVSGDPNDPPIMVVLADFENNSDDPSLTPLMNVVIRREMRQSPTVGIVTRALINKTLRYMQLPETTPMTPENAAAVCRRYNAHAVVHGAIGNLGTAFNVLLEANNCVTGETIYHGTARAETEDDLLRALDGLLPDMRLKLGEQEASVREFSVRVENATTGSMEAFHAFIDAENLRVKGESQKALPLYEKAARLDPHFAINWAAMGTVFLTTGQPERGKAAIQRANDESEHVSARERFYLREMYVHRVLGDFTAALPLCREWEVLYPADSAPWIKATDALVQLARYDEAFREGQEGLKRFPDDGLMAAAAMEGALTDGKLDEVKRMGDTMAAKKLAGWTVQGFLWQRAVLVGDDATANAARQSALGTDDEYDERAGEINLALQRGQLQQAEAMMPQFVRLAQKQQATERIDATFGILASTLAGLGDRSGALRILRSHPATTGSQDYAYAAALIGDDAALRLPLSKLEASSPQDTLIRHWYLPNIHAAQALSLHTDAGAQQALETLTATDIIAMHDLWAAYLRGLAYLQLHQDKQAQQNFRQVIDRRNVDAFSPLYPLAVLGLARAQGAAGDSTGSAQSYAQLRTLWSNADSALSAVADAKQKPQP